MKRRDDGDLSGPSLVCLMLGLGVGSATVSLTLLGLVFQMLVEWAGLPAESLSLWTTQGAPGVIEAALAGAFWLSLLIYLSYLIFIIASAFWFALASVSHRLAHKPRHRARSL